MRKRLVSGLLAMSMILSLVPISALAEGEGIEPVDTPSTETTAANEQTPETEGSERNPELDEVVATVNQLLEEGDLDFTKANAEDEATESAPTSEKVAEAIDEAQKSEIIAAIDAVAAGEEEAAKAEIEAAKKQEQAQENLDAAEKVVEDAQAEAEAAQKEEIAQEAADKAQESKEETQAQKDAAQEAADKAEDALKDAQEAASKSDAQTAADEAEQQSETAGQAAAEAVTKSDEAAKAAEAAEAAYNEAKAAADDAAAQVEALLGAGEEQMAEAKAAADAAAQLAEKKYREMIIAQREAVAAAGIAKDEVDSAKEDLKAAIDDLKNLGAEVDTLVEKAEVTAVTGAALGATKLAIEAAELVVDYYESDIEKLEQQINELQSAVDEANAAIADAEAKLAELDKDDADYPKAVAALEAAQKAKNDAQAIADNAATILEAKKAAEKDNTAEKMKELQSLVSDSDDKNAVTVRKELTEMVLENIGKYQMGVEFGDIKWVSERNDVFYVEDEEGNKTYYQVQTIKREEGAETEFYLQYCGAEYVPDTIITTKLPDADADAYNAGGGTTVYKACADDGTEYSITIKATKIPFTSKYTYMYYVDNMPLTYLNGNYYYGTKQVTVKDPAHFNFDDTPITTNSNTITEMWAQAEEAEQNLAKAEKDLAAAQENYNTAFDAYETTKNELNTIIADNQAIVDEYDALQEEKAEKEHTLNGGLGDQLLRATIEGDTSAMAQAGARVTELTVKAAFGKLTEEEKEELEDLKSALGTSEQLSGVISGISNGDVTKENIEAAVSLIQDNTLSIKTQKALAKKLEGLLEKQHEKAAEELQVAVDNAKEVVGDKAEVVGSAATAVVEKEVAFAEAVLAEKQAEKDVALAAKLKESAVQAATDAKTAYEKYIALANDVTVDRTAVDEAKAAYDRAAQAATDAQALADEAANAAARAQDAAAAARKLADEFPVPEEAENVPEDIAEYAYRFNGRSDSQLTNPEFAQQVYAQHGYNIDLSSKQVEVVRQYGTVVENDEVESGDLICILAEDGVTVLYFGVYYGNGLYSFFNELTGKVEIGRCADAPYGWIVIRIAA
ncbi:MAG: hypothetical protein ACI4JC_08980 [Faecalibacterium sp.]